MPRRAGARSGSPSPPEPVASAATPPGRRQAPGAAGFFPAWHSVGIQRAEPRLAPSVPAAAAMPTGSGRLGCLGSGRAGGGRAGSCDPAQKKKTPPCGGAGPSWFVVGPVVRPHCFPQSQSASGRGPPTLFPPRGGHATFFLPFSVTARPGGRISRAAAGHPSFRCVRPRRPGTQHPHLVPLETTCVPTANSSLVIKEL